MTAGGGTLIGGGVLWYNISIKRILRKIVLSKKNQIKSGEYG